MITKAKILFIIYAIVFVTLVIHTTTTLENQQIVTKASFERYVDVDKKKLFDLMADDEKYPVVLPENVISVYVINSTNNVTFANEVLEQNGIRTQLIVKHTIVPYDHQTLEIMTGDANGTKITTAFEDYDNQTRLETSIELHLKGILTPFAYLPLINLEHAMNTIIDHFINYLKSSHN